MSINRITVTTRGCDLSFVSDDLKDAWTSLYSYTALQVWTWRGGEAIVCRDSSANYGRGLGAVVIRTGGLRRGKIQVLHVDSMRQALDCLSVVFRIKGTLPAKRRERTHKEMLRATLALAARRAGHTFRTLHARAA